ncbi:hypothetical protein BJ742DRAFT_801966 [Cladochytrium replicatum]|nr:hypothetical protein BJ742DRAFT_801966 [Cladochytrium replicatum]
MTNNIIIVAGYGPGISRAVAIRFGTLGYKVALLSRTRSRLDAAAQEISQTHNIDIRGFAVDLSDTSAVRSVIPTIRASFGPDSKIKILHWNAYGSAASLLSARAEDIVREFNVVVTSLWIAIQEVEKDLEETKGAVLVTGGGMSTESDQAVKVAIAYGAATLAVPKAAQRKLVHIAHETLKAKGIYVGEITVLNQVKGTPFDPEGKSTLTAEAVADLFVKVEREREQVFTTIF